MCSVCTLFQIWLLKYVFEGGYCNNKNVELLSACFNSIVLTITVQLHIYLDIYFFFLFQERNKSMMSGLDCLEASFLNPAT